MVGICEPLASGPEAAEAEEPEEQLEYNLKDASEELCANRAVVMMAVQQNGMQLRYANVVLRKDKEVVMAAVQQCGGMLQWAGAELRQDKAVVTAAVKQNARALEWASDNLKDDKDVVTAAVQKYGGALAYASTNMKDNKDVVTAAVQQYPRALEFASTKMKDNKEVKAAIEAAKAEAAAKAKAAKAEAAEAAAKAKAAEAEAAAAEAAEAAAEAKESDDESWHTPEESDEESKAPEAAAPPAPPAAAPAEAAAEAAPAAVPPAAVPPAAVPPVAAPAVAAPAVAAPAAPAAPPAVALTLEEIEEEDAALLEADAIAAGVNRTRLWTLWYPAKSLYGLAEYWSLQVTGHFPYVAPELVSQWRQLAAAVLANEDPDMHSGVARPPLSDWAAQAFAALASTVIDRQEAHARFLQSVLYTLQAKLLPTTYQPDVGQTTNVPTSEQITKSEQLRSLFNVCTFPAGVTESCKFLDMLFGTNTWTMHSPSGYKPLAFETMQALYSALHWPWDTCALELAQLIWKLSDRRPARARIRAIVAEAAAEEARVAAEEAAAAAAAAATAEDARVAAAAVAAATAAALVAAAAVAADALVLGGFALANLTHLAAEEALVAAMQAAALALVDAAEQVVGPVAPVADPAADPGVAPAAVVAAVVAALVAPVAVPAAAPAADPVVAAAAPAVAAAPVVAAAPEVAPAAAPAVAAAPEVTAAPVVAAAPEVAPAAAPEVAPEDDPDVLEVEVTALFLQTFVDTRTARAAAIEYLGDKRNEIMQKSPGYLNSLSQFYNLYTEFQNLQLAEGLANQGVDDADRPVFFKLLDEIFQAKLFGKRYNASFGTDFAAHLLFANIAVKNMCNVDAVFQKEGIQYETRLSPSAADLTDRTNMAMADVTKNTNTLDEKWQQNLKQIQQNTDKMKTIVKLFCGDTGQVNQQLAEVARETGRFDEIYTDWIQVFYHLFAKIDNVNREHKIHISNQSGAKPTALLPEVGSGAEEEVGKGPPNRGGKGGKGKGPPKRGGKDEGQTSETPRLALKLSTSADADVLKAWAKVQGKITENQIKKELRETPEFQLEKQKKIEAEKQKKKTEEERLKTKAITSSMTTIYADIHADLKKPMTIAALTQNFGSIGFNENLTRIASTPLDQAKWTPFKELSPELSVLEKLRDKWILKKNSKSLKDWYNKEPDKNKCLFTDCDAKLSSRFLLVAKHEANIEVVLGRAATAIVLYGLMEEWKKLELQWEYLLCYISYEPLEGAVGAVGESP